MMSKLLATCAVLAVLAVTAAVSLPAQAAPARDHNASMKSGAIEVSSARRFHHRTYRHRAWGPRYGYYGRPYYGAYGAYAYDPYYRPAPYVGVGIGPFGFGIW